MRKRAPKPGSVGAHVESLLREYRAASVETLRALPPSEDLADFHDGKHPWSVYRDIVNLDDGGVLASVCATRTGFFRYTCADGFVMNAAGVARELTRDEYYDLT